MSLENRTKAQLVLHGGETFEGYSFGYEESVGGEVVFATGMVGYPESLTDPSYHGQIVVMTSPMIGNYGIPRIEEDCFGLTKFFESIDGKIYVTAVVVQEYCDMPDHWELFESLGSWLRRQKIPGMMMVDTRSIVLKLRDMGTALGKLVIAGRDVPFVDPNTRNLVAEVSRRERRTYGHGTLVILVIDMGVKLNTLRCLLRYDVTLVVVPHDHDITTEVYDGLFISNGPGNPQMCTATIRNVRWALQQNKPIFGICMGNQMLALAAGGKTYKMKYGHRGQNQPCRCTVDNRVVITTQNHGFAVDFDSLDSAEWEVYFANPNDASNEGLRHRTKPFYSVQFHPEGRCGPQDTEYLFGEYLQRVKTARLRELMHVKPRKVLVLGAGGIVIAQAGEFDYSGSQCLKALREEGIETVLVNPNIATVQTDSEMADRIYFVPLTAEAVERVIEKERPDGIMLAWGGQTALNCGLALDKAGVLQRYHVQVLGTPVSVIAVTEDRELFRDALLQINEHVATSAAVTSVEEALAVRTQIGYPMMVRAAYTLGGQGSGIVHNDAELQHKVQVALATAPQVLLEQSVAGWKEIEYEVVRDIYDNCITVCNMENVDPMGVHTGESIVVAPSQTLSNDEYHMLRSTSIKIIRHLGIIGECNIQYGLDPHSHRYVVIEVNARLSRSSALASKATGYPLAHVAANIALGKGLFEIVNGVTKTTMACFEPSLDYIVVKMPRWDLAKFNMVSEEIGSMMKSVGEVMAIGRTFEEGLQKAIRMVDPSYDGFDVPARYDDDNKNNDWSATLSSTAAQDAAAAADERNHTEQKEDAWDYMRHITHPTPLRIFAICRALQRGHSVEELHQLTRITRFFLYKLERLVQLQRRTRERYAGALQRMPAQTLRELKGHGFSDAQLARYTGSRIADVRAHRRALQVLPWVKQIDTLAGEVPAAQCCYLYTTYNAQSDDVDFEERMYVVLGCGVYRIGNSVEFDYAGVLVARELRRLGNKVIMINYNPETVSTDYDECDRLYFDEVSEETVLDVLYKEKARGVVISLGGQIVQNMALSLKEQGVPILGTDPDNIDRAEDRNKFSRMCDELGVPQPEWVSATSVSEVHAFCARVGFPALVRPSYVLSGSAMAVIASRQDVDRYLREASLVSGRYPVVVSKYYENAMEYDVDIVAHHGRVLCYAICEHVENAGVHSGDATMFLPPQNTPKTVMKRIYDTVTQISAQLDVTGPMNVQFLLTQEGQLRVIEANVRSSRSVPFVSKTLGISFPAMMVSAFLAQPEDQLMPIKRAKMTHIGCKASMFSFSRLAGADPISGVEMASTGEVGVFGRNKQEVFLKAMLCQGMRTPHKGVFIEGDADVAAVEGLCAALRALTATGLPVYCTRATAVVLAAGNVPHTILTRRRPHGAAAMTMVHTSRAVCHPHHEEEEEEEEEEEKKSGDTVTRDVNKLGLSSGDAQHTRMPSDATRTTTDEAAGNRLSSTLPITYEDAVAERCLFDLVIQLRDKKKDFMLRRCTRETATPDYWVRRLAVDYGIPLITEPNLAKLFCEAITSPAARTMEVEPFRFYVPKIYVKVENNNCAALRSQRVGLLITNNNASKVLALRLAEAHLDLTCFHAYLGGSNIAAVEEAFRALQVPVEVVDLRCEIADAAFDLVMCQSYDASFNWHLSKLAWHIYGKCLLLAMVQRGMTTVAQSSKQSKKEIGFEQYVQMYAPHILVYNAWRDSRLMEDFTSEEDQLAYLRAHGVATPLSTRRRCPPRASTARRPDGPVAAAAAANGAAEGVGEVRDANTVTMKTMDDDDVKEDATATRPAMHNNGRHVETTSSSSDVDEEDEDDDDADAVTFARRMDASESPEAQAERALKRVSRAGEVHNSVCGITHYCRNLGALPQPTYAKALRDCSETPEFVSLTYRAARCVNVNGVEVTPLLALQMTNEIAGRNGVGVSRTREGAMYEAPGMRLLATGLRYLYDVCFDGVSADLFKTYSSHIAQQLAVGQYSQKHTQSAVEAVRFLTAEVSGVVELELNRGDIIFLKLSHVTNAVGRRVRRNLVTAEEQEEVFQQGNGSFSDVQW